MSQRFVRRLSKKTKKDDAWVPNTCEQEILDVLRSIVDADTEYPNREEIHSAVRSLTKIAEANKLSLNLKQRIRDDLQKIDKTQLPSEQRIDYANFDLFT